MSSFNRETWEQYRRRMLRETEEFIEYGLRHPEEIIPIPSRPISQGPFPTEMGRWFWGVVLTSRTDSRWKKLRDRLRLRSRVS